MAFHVNQFADLMRRVLANYGLGGEAAENLLLGTAAVESRFGTCLRQVGGGLALGVFQMERPTFEWLRETYLGSFPEIENRCFDELEWDLRLAILFARLRYHAVPAPLPAAEDTQGLGAYWKEHYNTRKGKGTVAGFVAAYREFVEGKLRHV